MNPAIPTRQIRLRPTYERLTQLFGLATIMAGLLVHAPTPASADVVGPACVENGGLIAINGKRSAGKCVEGTPVRLYGVLAPPLALECKVAGDETWRCGLASAAALLQAVKGRDVECRGNSRNAKGQLVAICFINGRSVNQFMVEMGWAEADRAVTSMLNEYEVVARTARRGLWSSDYLTKAD